MEDAKKRTQCVNDILKKTLAYESEKSVGLFTFFDNNQNVKSAFAKKDKKESINPSRSREDRSCFKSKIIY